MSKTYILYDGRAVYDTSRATVLLTQDEKPLRVPSDCGDAVWAEYDLTDGIATNERIMWELVKPADTMTDCYIADKLNHLH